MEDNHQTLAIKARKIYNGRLRQTLEVSSLGQFVAIDVNSGEYFWGRNPLEAIEKSKLKYPGRKFHLMKVGIRELSGSRRQEAKKKKPLSRPGRRELKAG